MKRSSHFTSLLGKTRARQMHQTAHVTERKVRVGYAIALALLLILGVVLYQTTLKFRQTERWESQIEAELAKLEEISSQLKDAETGQRGYLITGDEEYLEPYFAAKQT